MTGTLCGSTGRMCGGLAGVLLWILLGSAHRGSGQVPGVGEEIKPAWPTHTVCSAGDMHITYTSCDPVQDVGISVTPCPPIQGQPVIIRLSAPLRYSVQELYLSADITSAGSMLGHYEETLCTPDFPRFSVCDRLRGEMIHLEKSVMIKWYSNIIQVEVGAHTVLLNEDGRSVACVNITVNMQGD